MNAIPALVIGGTAIGIAIKRREITMTIKNQRAWMFLAYSIVFMAFSHIGVPVSSALLLLLAGALPHDPAMAAALDRPIE